MKCLEREKLFEYVNRLLESAETEEVRAHLEQCEACRSTVADYERLGAALDEWKSPSLSPWFDARLRARVAAEMEGGFWGVWGFLQWRRWLLPATVVALVVLAIVIGIQSQRKPQPVAQRGLPGPQQPLPPAPEKVQSREMPRIPSPAMTPHKEPTRAEDVENGLHQGFPELEDYDLLANFDVLSELPGKGKKIAN